MDAGANKIITVLDPATTTIDSLKMELSMISLNNNQIYSDLWLISTQASIEKYKFSDNFFSLILSDSQGVYTLFIENIISGTYLTG